MALIRVGASDLISSAVVEMAQLFEGGLVEAAGLSPANIAFCDATDVMSSISSSVLGFVRRRYGLQTGHRADGGLPAYIRGLGPDIIRIGGRIVQGLAEDPTCSRLRRVGSFAHRHGFVGCGL